MPTPKEVVAAAVSPAAVVAAAEMISRTDADKLIAAALDAARPRYVVTFLRPPASTSEKKTKATIEANANVYGAFGSRIGINGWAIGRDEKSKSVVVYVPSGGGGFYKHVGPRVVAVPPERQIVHNGVRITSQDDPDAVRDMETLKNAVLKAWASNPGFDREVVLDWQPTA